MAYTIMMDAGHGGWDNGAQYMGRLEKDDNLALTLAVGSILTEYGFDVRYTRTEDYYETPYQKAMDATARVLTSFYPYTAILHLFRTNTTVWNPLSIPIKGFRHYWPKT